MECCKNYESRLHEQCRSLGIEQNVIFAGYQPDVRPYMTLADMQVIPSLWEGTTLTVFEAMAMKLPIVSTDVDGLGEVLDHERTAMLVPPRSPTDLANAIKALLKAPEKAEKLATEAYQGSSRFDIASTVQELEQLYMELANTTGK